MLIRIKREIKKEEKELLKKTNSGNFYKALGFSNNDIEEGFFISKTISLGIPSLSFDKEIKEPVGKIFIDDNNKKVVFSKNSYYTKAFAFADILKYEIYENDKAVVQGRGGAALVGGLFFGATGAIIGSSGRRAVDETVNILKFIRKVRMIEHFYYLVQL